MWHQSADNKGTQCRLDSFFTVTKKKAPTPNPADLKKDAKKAKLNSAKKQFQINKFLCMYKHKLFNSFYIGVSIGLCVVLIRKSKLLCYML